jgi:hypothetical protein
MEMRIVAGDSESACVLADALTVAFGDARVSLRPDRLNVEVRVRGRSDQTVSPGAGHSRSLARPCQLQIASSRSGEMWLGERSYAIERWAPAGP